MNWMLAGVCCLSVGCSTLSRGIDIARLPPPYTVIIHDSGRAIAERTIAKESQDAQVLATWLERNQTGWAKTAVTYAPSRVIQGDSFSLNFTGDLCVLNCEQGQFSKKVDATPLSSMFAAAVQSRQ